MSYNYSWWNKNKNNNNNSWNKTNYSNYSTATVKPVVETKEVEQEVTIQDNYTYLKNLLCKPKIETLEFTPYAWAKINCYINLIGEKEITGFGKIENGFITDVKIIKQSVRSAYVQSNDDYSIAEFLSELPMEDIEQGLWNLDWHSHVNMQAFASGTDWGNYQKMLELRNGQTYPAMVINKRGDIWCKNILGDQKYTDITVYLPQEMISESEFKKVYDECKQDILAKCKVVNVVSVGGSTYGYNYGGVANQKDDTDFDYSQNSGIWGSSQNYTTEDDTDEIYDNAYCKCCGTELLQPQEIETGLCEDCANSVQ